MSNTWRKELKNILYECMDLNQKDLDVLNSTRKCGCKVEDIGYAKGCIDQAGYLLDLFGLRGKEND